MCVICEHAKKNSPTQQHGCIVGSCLPFYDVHNFLHASRHFFNGWTLRKMFSYTFYQGQNVQGFFFKIKGCMVN